MNRSINNSYTSKAVACLIVICAVFSPALLNAHIDEGAGQGLQLFSYRLTGERPVIDGSILSRDGDFRTKDAPDEWKEAYTREIIASDSTLITLFIMNDDDSLYLAAIFRHTNNSQGSGIAFYFDQGPTGGAHDGLLTGTSDNERSDACYKYIKGDALTISDMSWNGTAWIPDNDGAQDFRAAGATFSTDEKANHREFAIPLQNLKQGQTGNSDLNITTNDELGIFFEIIKLGSGAGEFYWTETNGNKNDPQAAQGWADLRLNISRTCFTFYSPVIENGNPTIDGSLSESAWTTSYSRDIILTNFKGDTLSATFKSIQNYSEDNIFIAMEINDPANDAANYLQVYFEEDGSDTASAERNYFLEPGQEDAVQVSSSSFTDKYWNGSWENDTEAQDSHLAASAFSNGQITYEIRVPYHDTPSNQDMSLLDYGVPGMFLRYFDASRPSGSQNFYWEFTGNADFIDADPKSTTKLSAGWQHLQLGVSYNSIKDMDPNLCASDADTITPPPIIIDTVTESHIVILDNSGLPLPGKTLFSDATSFIIKLSTTQSGVSQFQSGTSTLSSGDREFLSLTVSTGPEGDFHTVMQGTHTLSIGSAAQGNGTIESALFDTLIATWINPFDSNDVAADTVYIMPAAQTASLYFSRSAALADTTTQFTRSDATVYIIVADQAPKSGLSYTVTLTTGSGETETVTLSQTGSLLTGSISANYNSISSGNGSLQINLGGETILASYTDPLYPETVQRSAAYAAYPVQPPVASPANGTWFKDDTSLTLTSPDGLGMRYTTDGSIPTALTGTLYTGAISISANTTLKAVAFISHDANNYAQSTVITSTYYKRANIGTPSADPSSTYFTEDSTITLSPASAGDTIYYTLDGSVPTTTSTRYTSAIYISQSLTLNFFAVNGTGIPSQVVTETYNRRDTLALPVPNPMSCYFLTDTLVSLSHSSVPEAIIRYTLDGSTPDVTSPQYTSPLTFTQPTVLKARAFSPLGSNAYVPSGTGVWTYTPLLQLSTNPSSTSFNSSISVSLEVNNASASILYTLDGSTPATTAGGSTLAYAVPLNLISTTTVKAIAILTGWKTTEVLSETYTRSHTDSRLEILDSTGAVLNGSVLTANNTAFGIKISTNYAGNDSLRTLGSISAEGDRDSLKLNTITGSNAGFARIYQSAFPFSVTSHTLWNGTVESAVYDTLIVSWVNPLDETDIARDTLYIQPVNQQAQAFFSTSLLLDDTVSIFSEAASPLYIIITDQEPDPNRNYTATVNTSAGDAETVTLSWNNGNLSALLTANYNSMTLSNDNLEIDLGGEPISVHYIDPLYSENAQKAAFFTGKSVATPVFNPTDGTFFQTDTLVTITGPVGSTIHYTIDGSDPTHLTGSVYSSPIAITTGTLFKAVAFFMNSSTNYAISNIAQARINLQGQVGIPWATPPSTWFTESTTITLSKANPGDTIYYTLDGSVPSRSSSRYTTAIGFTTSDTIRFYAVNGTGIPSLAIQEIYSKRDTLPAPIANPATTDFLTDTLVVLSTTVSGARIFYTLDGSDPDSTDFLYNTSITITDPTTLKAVAYNPPRSDRYVSSAIITKSYTPILTVTATPTSSSFIASMQASLASNNSDASIFYTTNGSQPQTSAGGETALYTGPINIINTRTIKALAVKNNWRTSSTISETYTRTSTPSSLLILDDEGNTIPDNILMTSQTAFSLQIKTNYAGPAPLQSGVTTAVFSDAETLDVSTFTGANSEYASIYRQIFPLKLASGATINDSMETASFDTLIASWTNPFDNSDIVKDTVYIQPENISAQVYFTETLAGSATSSYTEAATTAYITVLDQPLQPGANCQVILTTLTGDSETIILSAGLTPGMFHGSITLSYETISSGDGTLQINLAGEQVKASFTDPLYSSDQSEGFVNVDPKRISAPVSLPDSGIYFVNDTLVNLSSSTTGAAIRYTLDNTTPDFTTGFLYNSSVSISATTRIKAVAYLFHSPDNYVLSDVSIFTYNQRDTVPMPFAESAGGYFTEITRVGLYADSGATIYYTLDGSNPDSATSTRYESWITVTENTEIRFYAVRGVEVPSSIETEIYTLRDTLVQPEATPGSVDFFSDTTVSMSHPLSGAQIRYTTDGTEPGINNALYISPLTITTPTTLTIRAFGPRNSDSYVPSVSVSYLYTPIAAPPVATPGDTTFITTQIVQLSTPTYGAKIYYTLNGDTPDTLSTLYQNPIFLTGTSTIKAIATVENWKTSEVVSFTYGKDFMPSVLTILDGNQREVNFLTELNSSFGIKIKTTEATLDNVQPAIITLSSADSETPVLILGNREGNYYTYNLNIPLAIAGIVNPGNNTVDVAYFDTLIASWTNPNNSLDQVSDTVIIRPWPRQAELYYSETPTAGQAVINVYPEQDSVHIIIKNQVVRDGIEHNLSVFTKTRFGDKATDTISVALRQLTSGTFVASVAIDAIHPANSTDDKLQITAGDSIRAVYRDPVYEDMAAATIAYGTPDDIPAVIIFTDANGLPLETNSFWNPASDSIYITYKDDYTDIVKQITLIIENTTGTGTKSYDTVTVTLQNPERQDSLGIWQVAIPVQETMNTDPANTVAEVYFKSDVTAQISAHSYNGEIQSPVQDTLTLARPDKQEVMTITDVHGNTEINRETDSVLITLIDQDFSPGTDTLLVDIISLGSGDMIKGLQLVQINDSTYQGIFVKGEYDVDPSDQKLAIMMDDDLRISYRDPVYENIITERVSWQSEKVANIFFTTNPTASSPIEAVNEYREESLYLIVETNSPRLQSIDTLDVTVKVTGGESTIIKVIETEVNSGIFISLPIDYAFTTVPSENNSIVESFLHVSNLENQMEVSASIELFGQTEKNELAIHAAYIPAEKAWITDGNDDGRADTIFIKYQKPLPELPDMISSIDWPAEEANQYSATLHQDAELSEISWYRDEKGNIDSSLIVIVLAEDTFEEGQTSPSATQAPSLRLPETPLFQGIELTIEDKMGPIIQQAEKRPSDMNYYVDADGKRRQNPDTLIITFSEAIAALHNIGNPWDSLILFAPSLNEKENAKFVKTLSEPVVLDQQGLQWMFIISNETGVYRPNVDDIIFLNPNAPYADLATEKNQPSQAETILLGVDGKGIISNSHIFVPVEGFGIGSPENMMANHSFDDNGKIVIGNNVRTLTNQDGSIEVIQEWIRPHGLRSDGTIDSKNQQCHSNDMETSEPSIYPRNCLSSVQVFSKEKYVAQIVIFDNLGKFVHSSVQRFGDCGELDNPLRRTPQGKVSWLVWNMKNSDGELVGTGVYIWKVKFVTPNGVRSGIYRQGIVRADEPDDQCAAE
ncbi:MAG: chitobiase/beta-hexosaminidase C-terminal domain-containing protein [Fibrobacteria bacterium]|nr:chitobiase/beta-hexosaminidase C-terminal domain-containing protein [Fibrobacteria bacterium]